MGHGQPDLIAGEGEDRRKHLGHRVEDQVQCGLGAAAGQAVAAIAVQAVLDDIQIERGENDDTEIIDGVGDGVEFVVAVGRFHLFHQGVALGHGPAVQLQHIRRGDEVGRVEVYQIV